MNNLDETVTGPYEFGNLNCDGLVELGDVLYLLNYLFKNGPPPGCWP